MEEKATEMSLFKYKTEIIKWWQDLNLGVNWPIKASSLKVVFKYSVLSEI